MSKRNISDRKMAAYWAKRVAELEAMRPVLPEEAIAAAEVLENKAEVLDESVAAAENTYRESGRVAVGDTVAARSMRNAEALGDARQAVWGNSTRALQCRDQSAALRRIASEPVGTALKASLADARRRAAYYANLAKAGAQ